MTTRTPLPHRRWLLPAAALWLGLMVLVWWYGNRVSPAWFDPAHIAPHGFSEPANVQRLLQALETVEPGIADKAPLFIRFSQPNCPCESLVENYHLLLLPTLQQQGLQALTVTPDHMQQLEAMLGPELREWVPSTPAILVLDATRQPAYFGPYHQDGICNSENSYLEPVLAALRAGQPVNIINTLVEGCFCPYPVNTAGRQS